MYNSADTRDSKIISAAIKKTGAILTLQGSNQNFNTISSNEAADVGKSPKNILNATVSTKASSSLTQGQVINSFRKNKVNIPVNGNSSNNVVYTPIDLTKFNSAKNGHVSKKGSNGYEQGQFDQLIQQPIESWNHSGNNIIEASSMVSKPSQTHKKNKSTDKIIKKVVANIIVGNDSITNSGGFLGPNSNKSNNTPKGGIAISNNIISYNAASKKNSPKDAIKITDNKFGQVIAQQKVNSIECKIAKKDCTSPKDKVIKEESTLAQSKIKNINMNQILDFDINKYIQKATTYSKPKNNKMSFQGSNQFPTQQPSTMKNNTKPIASNNLYSPKQSIIIPSSIDIKDTNDIPKKDVKPSYKQISEPGKSTQEDHNPTTNSDITQQMLFNSKNNRQSFISLVSIEEREKITAELSAESHILNSIVNFKKLISNDAPIENLKTLFTQDETLLKINNLNYEIHKIESDAFNTENDDTSEDLKRNSITVINANSIGKFNSAPHKLKQELPQDFKKVNNFELESPYSNLKSQLAQVDKMQKKASTVIPKLKVNREIEAFSVVRSKKYKLIFETINANIKEALYIVSELFAPVSPPQATQSIYNNYESNHQIIEIKLSQINDNQESESEEEIPKDQASDLNLLNISKELAKIENMDGSKESLTGLSKLSSYYFKDENNNSALSGFNKNGEKNDDMIESYNCKFKTDIKQKPYASLTKSMKPQKKILEKGNNLPNLEDNDTMNDFYLEKMNIISNTIVESLQNESLGISDIYINNEALYGFIDESISVIENISNQLNTDNNIETDYYRILTKLPQGKPNFKHSDLNVESNQETQFVGKKFTKRASDVSSNEMDVTIENSYLGSKHTKKYSQILNNLEKLKHMVS